MGGSIGLYLAVDLSSGFKYLTMNNETRIQMEISNNCLQDSIMEIIMLRFPTLIQDIFEELDDKSCKIASFYFHKGKFEKQKLVSAAYFFRGSPKINRGT